MKQRQKNARLTVAVVSVLFLCILAGCLLWGSNYVNRKLLKSNESMAMDIAELVKNNFEITDAEVSYMKSLTFNEMEVDPINLRLMEIGNNATMNTQITNIYLVAPLAESEVKYYTDEKNADKFMCEPGTALNAVWLLNGRIDNGKFQVAEREDIYRYTDQTAEISYGFQRRENFGTYSSDEWGSFITGYVPVYSVEGNYVGMLGIDMDPDRYQASVRSMVAIIILLSVIVTASLLALFLVIYYKYSRVMEEKIYFDFYSKMSHDMRTPMNGILGMVHLAETEDDPKELHQYFHKVGESSEYLMRLINDTLDVSKISSGKMTLNMEAVSFADVVTNITDMIEMSAQKRQIQFKKELKGVESDCYVSIDEVRFKQIFMNLLSNALKYTKPDGSVQFEVEKTGQDKDIMHYRFLIQDSGVGMSEDFVKKSLYHPFAQEHNRLSNQFAGSGLGLVITKSLVDLMKGTITAESRLGKGTKFVVELDIQEVQRPEMTAEQAKEKVELENLEGLKGLHILLCEDQSLNAEIGTRLLERKGCIVDVAENGERGIARFLASPIHYYDAILMDIRMPIMDGLEASRGIRALDRQDADQVPIIAMTANAYAEDMEESRAAGMNAHLSKPIEPKLLYGTLVSEVGKRRE